MMQHKSPSMAHGASGSSMMGGGMMGSMMGGGMMGNMMGGGMMVAGAGLSRKAAMQMRGEMTRARGDILLKYAERLETPKATMSEESHGEKKCVRTCDKR